MPEEFKKQLHTLVHNMSMLSEYRPTEFEKKIGKELLREFSKMCNNCRIILRKVTKKWKKD